MADNTPTREELLKVGMLEKLSMQDFKPDQRLVDAALNYDPMRQQGGSNVGQSPGQLPTGFMSNGASQFGSGRGSVSDR